VLYRQVPVRVVLRLRLVGAPAVRPDLRWPEQLPTGAQYDAERLIVEN